AVKRGNKKARARDREEAGATGQERADASNHQGADASDDEKADASSPQRFGARVHGRASATNGSTDRKQNDTAVRPFQLQNSAGQKRINPGHHAVLSQADRLSLWQDRSTHRQQTDASSDHRAGTRPRAFALEMLALCKRRVACFRRYPFPPENRTPQRRRNGACQQLRIQKTVGQRSILRAGWFGARVWHRPERPPRRAPPAGWFRERFPFENAIASSSTRRLRQVVIFGQLRRKRRPTGIVARANFPFGKTIRSHIPINHSLDGST